MTSATYETPQAQMAPGNEMMGSYVDETGDEDNWDEERLNAHLRGSISCSTSVSVRDQPVMQQKP